MKQIREDVQREDTVVKAKTTHHSQTDAAKGFGGKYGVQKERQDKVYNLSFFFPNFPNNIIICSIMITYENILVWCTVHACIILSVMSAFKINNLVSY